MASRIKKLLFIISPEDFISGLDPIEVYSFYLKARDIIFYFWHGELTTEFLNRIHSELHKIEQILDFKKLEKRAKPEPSTLEREKSKKLENSTKTFPSLSELQKKHRKRRKQPSNAFPELTILIDRAKNIIINSDWGPLEKADFLLKALARDYNNESNYEACVYAASRGDPNCVDIEKISDLWRSWIYFSIRNPRFTPITNITKSIQAKLEDGSLTMIEAAELLRLPEDWYPMERFWTPLLNQDEEFADTTMLRMVEWFGIGGFDPWWQKLAKEIQQSISYGFEQWDLASRLFIYSRSDLLMNLIGREYLENQLFTLCSSDAYGEPWKLHKHLPKKTYLQDNIEIASQIVFIWGRIKPKNIDLKVIERALNLLMGTQLPSGGWPFWLDDSSASIMTTSTVIHALAITKPRGWESSIMKASKWLESQQDPLGFWTSNYYQSVVLTVLVMDSLALAEQRNKITFKLEDSNERSLFTDSAKSKADIKDKGLYNDIKNLVFAVLGAVLVYLLAPLFPKEMTNIFRLFSSFIIFIIVLCFIYIPKLSIKDLIKSKRYILFFTVIFIIILGTFLFYIHFRSFGPFFTENEKQYRIEIKYNDSDNEHIAKELKKYLINEPFRFKNVIYSFDNKRDWDSKENCFVIWYGTSKKIDEKKLGEKLKK